METIETIVGTTANTTCTVATTDTSSNTNTSTSNSSNNIIDIQVSPPACAVIIDQQEKNGMTLFTSDDHTNANCNDPLLIRKDQEQQEEEPSIEITVDGHHEQELSTATAAAIHNRSPTTNTSSSSVAVTHSSPMLQCSKSSINKHHPTLLPSSSFSNTLNQSSPVVAKDKQSLNSSVVTEKTAELSSSSFLDASCDGLNLSLESNGTTTVIDKSTTTTTSHNNNNKGGVSLILPNELFADALEQLTDLAMATGIVSNPSSSSTDIPHGRDTHSSPHKIDNPSRGGKRVHAAKWVMEGEEPGRIYSAANSSSGAGEGKEHDNDDEEEEEEGDDDECEGDDCRPYDEEPVWKPPIQGPFRSEEELSAIVRMRYYKAMGKKTLLGGEDGSDYNNNNKKKDVGVKSYQESQRETIERWKSLKAEVSQQEVDRMKLSPSGGKNHSSSRKTVSKRKKNKKKKQKYESSTTTSGSYSEEGDGSSLDGVGLFDFSFLTRSLEEAWNQSQATLLEAMVGDKKKMGGSEEEEDSYASSTSSSSYEYEEEEEEGSCSPSDSSKEYKMKKERRGRRKGGKALKARNYHDDDNDDDEMESVEEEEEEDGYDDDNHVGRNGSVSNRNFLEDITDNGIVLTWHRPRSSTSAKLFKKVRLTIQISDTEDGNMEPNLVWEALEDRHREYQVPSRDKISLFDISSIEKASESLNLNAFPHAVADHSILITLNDGKVCLFEAKDMEQARGIIHGLRWIAARLTFNIIIGNFHICSEMISIKDQVGVSDYTKDMFQNVTNQLVEKTLIKF